MRAILMYEDNHGLIGLAACYRFAVEFLIEENWLNDFTMVWVNHRGYLLKEIFPHWREEIKNWDVETFNKYFDGLFHLECMKIHGVSQWR